MKKLLVILFIFFNSCNINKTKKANEIKIATFSHNLNAKDVKILQSKTKLKLKPIKFSFNKNLKSQIKKHKPELIIGAHYLTYELIKSKNHQPIKLNLDFYKNFTSSTKKLYQNVGLDNYQQEIVPLFLEDIKVFSNQYEKFLNSRANLVKLFADEKNNIVIDNNPVLIGWIAMNIFGKNLPPHSIANPDQKRLEQALKMFFKTKAKKSFYSTDKTIKEWKDIDIYIGPNWILNYVDSTKEIYNINNYNLITLNGVIKTKYGNENTDQLIDYIQKEYKQLSFATKYTPVTLDEAKAQYFALSDAKKYSMVLLDELNYYYFIDQSHNLNWLLDYTTKKIS